VSVANPAYRGLSGLLMGGIGVILFFFPQYAWKKWMIDKFGPPGVGTRIIGAVLIPAGIYVFATADHF
jgi:uncharacterized protein YjeT (DUF2065 family)